MRNGGRLSAAIEVLSDFERRRVPLKIALADWARGARFAGAKDRAWVSGLCLDVLRRRRSLAAAMNDDSPRAAAFGGLRWLWGYSADDLEALAAEAPHGPGNLTDTELTMLGKATPDSAAAVSVDRAGVEGDFPDWLAPHISRAFGDETVTELLALAERADVDLRINTLKTDPEKGFGALKAVGAQPAGILATAARIPAPPPSEKTSDVTIIPAFSKGWVEVQDLGSQIAAAAAGDIAGKQVLDYCAGGGGKSLALAAMMRNRGQLYAFDADPRRLKPIYERASRAGVRNLQIVNPLTDMEALSALKGRIDVVLVDAPCTGSGVWRRHPDSKWRLTPEQLATRMQEQDATLGEASAFVKPGGRLVYVTCSIFMEENEDRTSEFLRANADFTATSALSGIEASGLATSEGLAALGGGGSGAALRLTPARHRTDGFYIATFRRAGAMAR
ncbi:MAG: RsmB/NOP family class I SAM-dependent RNA methyltransferase [Parvularculaceae bacterium]